MIEIVKVIIFLCFQLKFAAYVCFAIIKAN